MIRSLFRRPRRPSWIRWGPTRGMSWGELAAALLAVAVAMLASCHHPGDEPDRSDPFEPPASPRATLRGAHRLPDGTVVLFVVVGAGHGE